MRTTASGGLRGLVFGPIGVLYVVFLLAPISYFLLLSVFKYSPMEMFIPGFTLENYDRFLGDSYYQGVLLTTFRIALITTLCSLLGAYPLAYFPRPLPHAMARRAPVSRDCAADVRRHRPHLRLDRHPR